MAKYADILFSGSAENLAQRKIPVGSPTNKHPCLPLLYDTGRVHGNHVCIEKRTADAPQESEQVPGTVCPNRKNIPHISKKMESLSTSARNRMEESAINADEKESDKTISNAVHCNQLVNVKFSITTNSGNTNDINGALIMLLDSIRHNYAIFLVGGTCLLQNL